MYRISIVTPTHNRLDRLRRTIAALERQTVPCDQFQVVIVSDGSRDGTNEYLRDLQTPLNLETVIQENKGVSAARNAGIARATGDIILFLDDDVAPVPTLVAEHLRLHDSHAEPVVVLGPLITPDDFDMLPWVLWEQWMLEKQYRAMSAGEWEPTPRQFFTGNASVPRRHLRAAGDFDPYMHRSEDIELGYRLANQGLRFVFNADAIGYHYAERSWDAWIYTPRTRGRNDALCTRDKGYEWVLPVMFREFRARHPLVRGITRLCLGRPRLSRAAVWSLRHVALAAHRLRLDTITRTAFSGVFNLVYYEGVNEVLGGREAFFAGVASAETPPAPIRPVGRSAGEPVS